MNRLFVAKKPIYISSNSFLSIIKRKYGVKKAGYSGTLDPFASGVLVVGFGSYTKLFRFLKKTPKVYRATLWLGLNSLSLDTENIVDIKEVEELDISLVQKAVISLKGEVTYTPPIFSAKKVDGKRAYELAREYKDVNLKKVTSVVYNIKLINYNHPFVTFEAEVSEGTYIRSLGKIIADKLGVKGSLSYLQRLREGRFVYEGEKPLDIRYFLDLKENFYKKSVEDIKFGRKLALENFKYKDNGVYFLDFKEFITIIEIKDKKVSYVLGRVLC